MKRQFSVTTRSILPPVNKQDHVETKHDPASPWHASYIIIGKPSEILANCKLIRAVLNAEFYLFSLRFRTRTKFFAWV
jgi:hypothetical protein